MYTFNVKPVIFAGAFLSLAAVVTAQKNITVPVTDPTIQYGPGTGDANICRIDSNGNVVAGQAGCYNLPSNCSDSIAAGQSMDSSASYKFKGSGIYITGVLSSLSPVYTVDLDGTSKDVDGVVDSLPFTCAPLFSATNLDPNVEHTIRLSIKGPSPNRNMTVDPDGKFLTFAMANFIYTVPDDAQTSNSAGTQSSKTSTGASPSPTSAATTIGTNTFTSLLGVLAVGIIFNYF